MQAAYGVRALVSVFVGTSLLQAVEDRPERETEEAVLVGLALRHNRHEQVRFAAQQDRQTDRQQPIDITMSLHPSQHLWA